MKTKNLLFAAIMLCSIVMVSCNQNEPKIGGVSFTEPCLEWGKSPSYVQQQMEKKGYSVKESDISTTYSDIIFTKPGSLENYQIALFENNKLYRFGVEISAYKTTAEDIARYLGEKYNFSTYEDGIRTYYTKDGLSLIYFGIDDDTFFIEYNPVGYND